MKHIGYARFIASFATCRVVQDAVSNPRAKEACGASILAKLSKEPLSSEPIALTPQEHFVQKVFVQFCEISESYENLSTYPILISRFPFKQKGIAPLTYLRVHTEGFLHEAHILRLRLDRYLTILQRTYQKHNNNPEIGRTLEKLRTSINDSFEGISAVRGRHVHEKRYTDTDFDNVKLFEILSKEKDEANWQSRHQYEFKEARRNKKQWMKRNLKSIEQILDYYCDSLYDIVFNDKGDLNLP